MTKLKIASASLIVLATAACSDRSVGTLNNQGAFGNSYVSNQSAQIAYGSEARLKNLGTQFSNEVPTMINFEFNKSTLDGNSVNYLASLGVKRSQLKALVSRGETQPLIASGGPERLNRRAVTGVSGFLQGFRGAGMDGKRAAIVYNEFVGDEGSEVVAPE